MRAAKVDNTHREIVRALVQIGCSVFGTATVGRGVPDLVASRGGFTALIECKTGRGKLNAAQERFHAEWQGVVIVARSGEEAVRLFEQAVEHHVEKSEGRSKVCK